MANMTFGTNLIPNNTSGQKSLGNSSNKWNIYANTIDCDNIVTGVKGIADGTYSTGQVNLSATNVGALPVYYTPLDYTSITTTKGIYPVKGQLLNEIISNSSNTTAQYGGAIQFGDALSTQTQYAAQLVVAGPAGAENPPHIYTRRKLSSAWTTWSTLLDDNNYTDYTVSKTGSGASGTWGIDITGTATNVTNTVSIEHGGTGGTTAAAARLNLGLGTMATANTEDYLPISGGTLTARLFYTSSSAIYCNTAHPTAMLYFLKTNNFTTVNKLGMLFMNTATAPDGINPYTKSFYFRQYSYDTTTNSYDGIETWEQYDLPIVTPDLTTAVTYRIFTTKEYTNLQAIENLTGTSGFLKKTATDTWALATADEMRTSLNLGTIATASANDYLPIGGGIITGTTKTYLPSETTFYSSGSNIVFFATGATSNADTKAAIVVGNSNNKIYFRQYSRDSSTGASLAKYEQYYFPTVNNDRTDNEEYCILSTRAPADSVKIATSVNFGFWRHGDKGELLAKSTDLDTLTMGTYYSGNSSFSSTFINTPITGTGFKLWHGVSYTADFKYQLALGANGNPLLRNVEGNSTNGYNWSNWKTFVTTSQPNIAVGSAKQPVYVTNYGIATACGPAYNNLLVGTGTVAGTNTPALWTFDADISEPADGDIITIKAPCAGHSNGVFLSLDNGINYRPIKKNVTGSARLATHVLANDVVQLVYDSDASTSSIYPVEGASSATTITGGAWKLATSYDTTYSTATAAEIKAATSTSARLLTPKLLTDHYNQIFGGTALTSGADLNTITTIGNYYASSSSLGKSMLHRPKSVSLYFYLKNYSLTGTDSAYIRQELTSYRNGTFFRTRPGASASWSDWFCNVVTKVDTAASSSDTGTTVVPGGILYGDSTFGTYCSYTAAGTTGQVLTSNGTAAPTWKTLIYYAADASALPSDAEDGSIGLVPIS